LDPACSKARGYNFEPERTTGKSNINHLERRWFNLVHSCRPTQVLVNIAYAHLHHHNTKSYMPTKKRKHNNSDNLNNKNGKRNADVDLQSENEQLGDPNKNYAVKGVQKLDFHTTTDTIGHSIRFSNWQETRPLLILWAIRISNWQATPPLLILFAIRFRFSN
jgi:hypothetical protein